MPEVDKEKRTVAFTIMVDPGRRVYVRRINVVGNTKTRDEVVRREMRQLEGAYYDAEKIQLSEAAHRPAQLLHGGGRRDRAGRRDDRPGRRQSEGQGEADRALLFGIGFSSSDKLILQGSITQQNIFGSGQRGRLIAANTSKVNRNLGLSYTNPYFTVDGVSPGFDVYDRTLRRASSSASATTSPSRPGGGVRIGYPITELDRINFGLTVEQTEHRNVRQQPAALRQTSCTRSATTRPR